MKASRDGAAVFGSDDGVPKLKAPPAAGAAGFAPNRPPAGDAAGAGAPAIVDGLPKAAPKVEPPGVAANEKAGAGAGALAGDAAAGAAAAGDFAAGDGVVAPPDSAAMTRAYRSWSSFSLCFGSFSCAAISAVRPFFVWNPRTAPALTRTSTQSASPLFAAKISGVTPSAVCAFRSAFASTSARTSSSRPQSAAQWSAVFPFLSFGSVAFTFAPSASALSSASWSPSSAAPRRSASAVVLAAFGGVAAAGGVAGAGAGARRGRRCGRSGWGRRLAVQGSQALLAFGVRLLGECEGRRGAARLFEGEAGLLLEGEAASEAARRRRCRRAAAEAEAVS